MTHQEQNVKTLTRFLDPGCLQPYLDKFASKLAADGYTPLSISNYLQSVAHFGSWIHNKGIVLGHINENVIVAFDNHRCKCPGGRRHERLSRRYVARVRRFIRYLSQQGIVDRVQEKAKEARPSSVVEFSEWMVRHRGISTRTVEPTYKTDTYVASFFLSDDANFTLTEDFSLHAMVCGSVPNVFCTKEGKLTCAYSTKNYIECAVAGRTVLSSNVAYSLDALPKSIFVILQACTRRFATNKHNPSHFNKCARDRRQFRV